MKLVKAGVDFALVKSVARKGAMPKRGAPLELVVNGNPVEAMVTSNAAWCGSPDLTLEYIWVPCSDGFARYVTLGYGERAAEWKDEEVEIVDGTGPKPVARLVAESDVATGWYGNSLEGQREAERVLKFKEWASKRK
jgi:hypothetical protein